MATQVTDDTERFYTTAKQLLIEYSKKLDDIRGEATKFNLAVAKSRAGDGSSRATAEAIEQRVINEYFEITNYFQQLFPAMESLARQVSQRIEHSALDDAMQIELRLRLAEFEAKLSRTQNVVTNTHL